MPITFRCTRCLEEIRVPDGTAGKKTRCPHCQVVQPIPAPDPMTMAPAPPIPPSTAPVPSRQASAAIEPSPYESPYETAPSFQDLSDESYGGHPSNPFSSPTAGLELEDYRGQPMSEGLRRAMRQKLLAPAITQLVIVSLGIVWCLSMAGFGIVMALNPADREGGIFLIVLQLAWTLPQIPAVIGLISAIRLQSIGWAWAGMIIPIFSFPLGFHCCCVLPVVPVVISIWGIACLSDPKVRNLFP